MKRRPRLKMPSRRGSISQSDKDSEFTLNIPPKESATIKNQKCLVLKLIDEFGINIIGKYEYESMFESCFAKGDDIFQPNALQALMQAYNDFEYPPFLKSNFKFLQNKMGLSASECKILHCYYMFSCVHLDDEPEYGEYINFICKLYDLPKRELIKIVQNENNKLAKLGLLDGERLSDFDSGSFEREAEVFFRHAVDEKRLIKDFGYKPKASKLTLNDFDYMSQNLNMLLKFAQSAEKGSILLYGAPGVGKNELVSVIAKELGKEIVCVADSDNDRSFERIKYFNMLQNIVNPATHIICFDECENVFCSIKAKNHKAHINLSLENTKQINFFLSNSEYMDDAFLRRFDIVLKIQIPPKAKNEQILKNTLSRKIKLDSELLDKVTKNENLSQGILVKAAKTANLFDSSKAQGVFLKCINENLRARHLKPIKLERKNKNDKPYDMSLIECSADIVSLAQNIKAMSFPAPKDEMLEIDSDFEMLEDLDSQNKGAGIRLLCYGQPGSGKTEFAKELARLCDKKLASYKASDLLSMWVGGTEANIARAFENARRKGEILHIDEVDTFLYSRESAQKSWEKSCVNEMLTQMENFDGVFIATSNHLQMLDSAVLRRFDSKIEFKPLGFEKLVRAFEMYARHLGILDSVDSEILQNLKGIKNACFGDFALIAREARFAPIKTQAELLEKLKRECALKNADSSKSTMGFGV